MGLRFAREFDESAGEHEVSRQHVERALRAPKWHQSLVTAGSDFPPEAELVASVFDPPGAAARDPMSLLILSRDERYDTVVYGAWRIYHSDVDLTAAHSAQDVLDAFLAKYGVEIQVNGSRARLIKYSRFDIDDAHPGLRVRDGNGRRVRVTQLVRFSPDPPRLAVAVAFAVDETLLAADLARHR
jgi:hypothetical protein